MSYAHARFTARPAVKQLVVGSETLAAISLGIYFSANTAPCFLFCCTNSVFYGDFLNSQIDGINLRANISKDSTTSRMEEEGNREYNI